MDVDLRRSLRMGLAGSVIVAVAGVGAGSLPRLDPFATWPVLRDIRGAQAIAVGVVYFGLTLLAAAWVSMGRRVRQGGVSPKDIAVTIGWWLAPLALAPPMWSSDVYSYLAQGEMLLRGINPYHQGPAALGGALGADVPPIWQHAPAPYGPVALGAGAAVMWLTGPHTVPAVLGMRVVALLGVWLTVRYLPRLARNSGVDPAIALWLGAANPLVLAHLVSGAHNDALMIGLMIAGLVLVLREPLATPGMWRHAPAGAGVALICLAALVKAPAVVALAFAVPVLASRLPGRAWARWPASAAAIGGLAALIAAAVTALVGSGYGWIHALGNGTVVRNGLSVSTDLGMLVGHSGHALGLLDVTPTIRFFRGAGLVAAVGVCAWAMLRVYRLGVTRAVGISLTAVVVLAPVVHPWYLLWGFVPLAAGALHGRTDAPTGSARRLARLRPSKLTTWARRVPVVQRFVIVVSLGMLFWVLPTGAGATRGITIGQLVGCAVGLLLLGGLRWRQRGQVPQREPVPVDAEAADHARWPRRRPPSGAGTPRGRGCWRCGPRPAGRSQQGAGVAERVGVVRPGARVEHHRRAARRPPRAASRSSRASASVCRTSTSRPSSLPCARTSTRSA